MPININHSAPGYICITYIPGSLIPRNKYMYIIPVASQCHLYDDLTFARFITCIIDHTHFLCPHWTSYITYDNNSA